MNVSPVDIVLIEDNPADVELTRRALSKFNLANRIEVINDGEQAMNYFFSGESNRAGLPKVILLDLNLPKVSGLEVLKALKSDERSKMIPVVVLTSSKEESDLVKSYKFGVNSYLVKPVDFEQFVESVGKLGMYWLLLNTAPEYS